MSRPGFSESIGQLCSAVDVYRPMMMMNREDNKNTIFGNPSETLLKQKLRSKKIIYVLMFIIDYIPPSNLEAILKYLKLPKQQRKKLKIS